MPSMSPQPLARTLADASRRWFLGSETWIRVGTEESAGSLVIVEHLIPPGSQSPWHVHHTQDEVLYVVEGTITVIIGGDRGTLGRSGCTFGPRGIPHGFRVEGEATARLLLICTPGEGFDRFIHEAERAGDRGWLSGAPASGRGQDRSAGRPARHEAPGAPASLKEPARGGSGM